MFPEFFFEGNQFFNWVKSIQDLSNLFTKYKDNQSIDWILDNAKVAPHAVDYAKYGLRRECDGEKTLRTFLTENGVRLPVCAGTLTISEYINEIK